MSQVPSTVGAGRRASRAAPVGQARLLMRGRRIVAALAALSVALVALAACCLHTRGGGDPRTPAAQLDHGRPFAVAALDARLERDPRAWPGRVVLVRAIAEPCPAWGSPHDALRCPTPRPVLADPDDSELADPLPLAPGAPTRMLSLARRLPLVGRFIPREPDLAWEVPRTYRIRLRAAPGDRCGAPVCFEAVVLRVTP